MVYVCFSRQTVTRRADHEDDERTHPIRFDISDHRKTPYRHGVVASRSNRRPFSTSILCRSRLSASKHSPLNRLFTLRAVLFPMGRLLNRRLREISAVFSISHAPCRTQERNSLRRDTETTRSGDCQGKFHPHADLITGYEKRSHFRQPSFRLAEGATDSQQDTQS